METREKKRDLDKAIIIVLLAAILIIVLAIGYLVVSDKNITIPNIFESDGEYTYVLDEFVVNLKSEDNSSSYLKIKIALMFTDEKDGEDLDSNVNKIRDIVISNLRARTAKELMENQSVELLKEDIKEDINTSLNKMIVQDVYITDIIVQ
ncbi:MAG: flagellar basal body-associated FliL family protein [Tissierellia bacterium]|nr:flagellar basal body-associated FliL family protein [Tissierellia bacterium]